MRIPPALPEKSRDHISQAFSKLNNCISKKERIFLNKWHRSIKSMLDDLIFTNEYESVNKIINDLSKMPWLGE